MIINEILESKERIFKYRYILIAVIGIIIILLIIMIGLLSRSNKNVENPANSTDYAVANDNNESENEVMVVEYNKEEEEKKEVVKEEGEEEKKEQEKIGESQAKGEICLTFDDGPSSDITPKILDILEKRGIKATFFVLHYSQSDEDLVKKEAELGETIGLHGYSHVYSEVYQSADICIDNYRKIQQQVLETTGKKSNIIRFPGGSSNTISKKYCEGIMTELTKRVIDEGFRYFDWNVDSRDSGGAKTSDQVYNNVVAGIKENRTNVVLMHDFHSNQKTVDALDRIISYGLDNGFVFKNITDETKAVTHAVNN